MSKFQNIAIMITIFISSYIFFRSPFEGYVSYLVYVLFFPIYIAKFGVPRQPILIFLPLLIAGIVYVQSGLNTVEQFVKIFIGFFAAVLFYNYVFQAYKFDLKYLFRLYMKGAYIVSLIGLVQFGSFVIGFTPGYDFSWIFNKWSLSYGGLGIRMNSVFSEPAYFAAVVAPAFYVAVYSFLKNKKELFLPRRQLVIIFIAYFFTFSTLGIIGMFVILLLLLANLGFLKYAVIIGPALYFGFNYAYDNIDEFRERLEGTEEVFAKGNIKSYSVHGSSFVLYNNYHIASENFKEHPFFGTGLGSHPIAFDKYSLTNLRGVVQIDFNKMDANSMALRLMSETGLYGMIFMVIFLIRCFIFKPRANDEELWIISSAALIVITLYLARQGHYFLNGFPFFLWLYYFTWKVNRGDIQMPEQIEEPEEDEPIQFPNPINRAI